MSRSSPTRPSRGASGDSDELAARALAVSVWRSRRNPGGLLYGMIITGAVIAVASGISDSGSTIAGAVAEILVVYWAAHVYTRVIADRLLDPSAGFVIRAREALRHELAVLVGGLPGLGAFGLSVALGASASAAADLALLSTAALLGTAGYAVGRQAGARGWALALEVVGACGIGAAIVALKTVGIH